MKQEIGTDYPDKSVIIEWMLLDLSSFRSTKDFTVAFREKNLPLHILINNAGIAWLPLSMWTLIIPLLSLSLSLFLSLHSNDRRWL